MDTFTDADRARIRAVLLGFGAENRLSVEKIYKRLCASERQTPETVGFSFKTFQRFLAGDKGDKAIDAAARFAKSLPNRPDAFHALGAALHAMYKTPLPSDIEGRYSIEIPDGDHLTQIAVASPFEGFALVTERHVQPWPRIHDGVLFAFAHNEYIILSRDRLLLSPRYISIYGNSAVVFDEAKGLNIGPQGRTGRFKRSD